MVFVGIIVTLVLVGILGGIFNVPPLSCTEDGEVVIFVGVIIDWGGASSSDIGLSSGIYSGTSPWMEVVASTSLIIEISSLSYYNSDGLEGAVVGINQSQWFQIKL